MRDDIVGYPMIAASWCTAAELRELDWNMTIRHRVATPLDDDVPAFLLDASVDHPVVDIDGTILRRNDILIFVDEGPDRRYRS